MSGEISIVCFDDGRGLTGPFKVYESRAKADEFVRLCREGGDHRRVVVTAEFFQNPKPLSQFEYWPTTTVSLNGLTHPLMRPIYPGGLLSALGLS